MTPVSDAALESLHNTAIAIFTGALEACSISSAFDRRIRFEVPPPSISTATSASS